MVKVLHVILSLEIGGMEQVVVDLVRATDRSRFEPEVLCVQKLGPLGEELLSTGFPVMLLSPMIPLLSFIYPKELVKAIRQSGADVIHVHSGCWFKGALAAKICSVKKVVYTLHGANYAKSGVLRILERIAARLTDSIVAVSADLAAQLNGAGHIPMEKVSVIINGVDSGKFAMTTRAKSPSAPIRIGTVARLEPVKDHATLLQAMRVLVDKGADVQLEIIGDGSSRQSLEQLVKDLGLNDLVRFLGAQRDIPSLLAGIDIFALSSLSEGTSISILEAMAAGKPVVATAVGGNPALVHDDKNGLLVPPSDPEALAEALLWLIKDEELRLRIGKVNRNMAELKFGKSTMTRLYECLYTD